LTNLALRKDNWLIGQAVTWSVAEALVCLIDGISNSVVEGDNSNAGSDLETPPCLPHELVSLNGHDFAELLQLQRGRNCDSIL
jgi:hypothetical protein